MAGDSLINSDEGTVYLKGRMLGEGVLNQTPDSCKDCTVSCEDQWSSTQMENIALESKDQMFLQDPIRRAKRTAGNYAQLFLGDESTDKAGRFYWPGLAAFAAKEVVAGMELALQFLSWDKPQAAIAQARASAVVTFYYLAKGNLWVFLEVTTWHLFYKKYGKELFEHCKARRNVDTYDEKVKPIVKALPWATGQNDGLIHALRKKANPMIVIGDDLIKDGSALAEMKNCQITGHLSTGFAQLELYEASSSSDERKSYAYRAAWAFLNHEQTLHLQAMVYDHPEFRSAIDMNDFGRLPVLRAFSGAKDPTVFFNASAEITPEISHQQLKPYGLSEDDIKVKMDEGKLYLTQDRMLYVQKILDKYHFLMTRDRYREYMIGQISTIAGWKDA
ncbi:hypothetical protein LMG24238_06213 [Paraburkholderia sediminicola]|uniref:Uncharacterized protein n=1 Tax=Paraburkholderia sediminicola TaxID=458836 RepID=A0A6J5CH66_9BURK|nr:hypothetical protein [Paraburkholderia sediminicola]CAB3736269.1 hypothetical protein LMG24238_06213 [Paraburkholderia sediminicola]